MIALESLSCTREPALHSLSLTIGPGELPAIVGADAEERAALVELLAGYRSESAGAFLRDGEVLAPRARKNVVVVLPHKAALTPDLTVAEHFRLLSRLRGAKLSAESQKKLLEFSQVESAGQRPGDLEPASQLRLTLALTVVGRPALVVALDPPPEVGQLMLELEAPDRSLLLVTGQLVGVEAQVTRVHGLQNGRLADGISAPAPDPGVRAFEVRVGQGGSALEALFTTHAGVTVDKVSNGLYRLRVLRDVPVAPLIRALVSAGVVLEAVTPLGEGRPMPVR